MIAPDHRSSQARKAGVMSQGSGIARYLAVGLGATGLASMESEAAIVNLDISALGSSPSVDATGTNAGLAYNSYVGLQNLLPSAGSGPQIFNYGPITPYATVNWKGFTGYNTGSSTIEFANGGTIASPRNFGGGATIDDAAANNWSWNNNHSLFSADSSAAANFGAGSYIGFRVDVGNTGEWNYGYFEVTWDSATEEFEILSGAYESDVDVPIATPVPEPSTVALTGIGALALGAGAIRRSRQARKNRQAAADEALAESA